MKTETRSLISLAYCNKLTRKKCVMCPNFLQAKKHKYCCNKCARKAEKRFAKIRRLAKEKLSTLTNI